MPLRLLRVIVTDEKDTIDLGRYLRTLQRRWKAATAGALTGGVLAFAFASSLPLRYEGITTLLVTPAQGDSAQVSATTFRGIVENVSLASQIISELKLGEGEFALTPLEFIEDALRVEELRGTNLIRVKVTLRDPRTAAEASRRFAAKAIALTQQISQLGGASTQEQLKGRLTDARSRLASAEKEFLTYSRARRSGCSRRTPTRSSGSAAICRSSSWTSKPRKPGCVGPGGDQEQHRS